MCHPFTGGLYIQVLFEPSYVDLELLQGNQNVKRKYHEELETHDMDKWFLNSRLEPLTVLESKAEEIWSFICFDLGHTLAMIMAEVVYVLVVQAASWSNWVWIASNIWLTGN